MTNPISMLQRSAISEQSQKSTAINEVMMRLKIFSLDIDKSKSEECLVKYMDNLIGIGFSEPWRRDVMTQAVKKYEYVMNLGQK